MALVAPVENGKIVETASQASVKKSTKSSKSGMDKEAFLQLLVAQMKYQDPLEPTSNTEYISQYAQFSQVEQMQNMSGRQGGLYQDHHILRRYQTGAGKSGLCVLREQQSLPLYQRKEVLH